MPDHNPSPWPPEPQTGATENPKPPAYARVGTISLIVAGGLLLLQLFVTLAFFSAGDGPKILDGFIRSSPVYFLVWFCATGYGIVARRSIPGKLGIVMSVVNLGLYGYLLYQYSRLTF
jgi:hypothetical protein